MLILIELFGSPFMRNVSVIVALLFGERFWGSAACAEWGTSDLAASSSWPAGGRTGSTQWEGQQLD